MYARPEVQELIEPLIVGHGWHLDERSEQPLIDYVEQYGTRDLAAFLSVPAALEFMEAHDWPRVRAECYAQALATKRMLEQTFGTEPICPESFEWFSQLCPIRLPDNTDMAKLSQIFREHYQIEMPLITWNNFKIARLSVQIYTIADDLDAFVEALTTHLPACQPE